MMSKYVEGGHHGTPAPAVTPLTPGTLRSPVTLSCQRQLCLASPVPTSLPGLLSEGYTNAPNLALRRKQAGLSTLKLKSGGRIWGPCRSCRLLAVGGGHARSLTRSPRALRLLSSLSLSSHHPNPNGPSFLFTAQAASTSLSALRGVLPSWGNLLKPDLDVEAMEEKGRTAGQRGNGSGSRESADSATQKACVRPEKHPQDPASQCAPGPARKVAGRSHREDLRMKGIGGDSEGKSRRTPTCPLFVPCSPPPVQPLTPLVAAVSSPEQGHHSDQGRPIWKQPEASSCPVLSS